MNIKKGCRSRRQSWPIGVEDLSEVVLPPLPGWASHSLIGAQRSRPHPLATLRLLSVNPADGHAALAEKLPQIHCAAKLPKGIKAKVDFLREKRATIG
jgi:hypothetical protein